MIQLSDFAKEINRSTPHVICEILDYNFDLGLQIDQRIEFTSRMMTKVRYLMTKAKVEIPEFVTDVFELPMTVSTTCRSRVSPHQVKGAMSNETDVLQSAVETGTLGLKNGPTTDICIKD
ncbi:unnamed protein product [Coregonus sp. 'balchen']|nr:unnamed protein product [Coregonus sp. 'balchen']